MEFYSKEVRRLPLLITHKTPCGSLAGAGGIFIDNDFNLLKKNINFPITDRSTILVNSSIFDNNTYLSNTPNVGIEIKNVKSRRTKLFTIPEFFETIIILGNSLRNTSNGVKIKDTNTKIVVQRNNFNHDGTLTRRMSDAIIINNNNHSIPSIQSINIFPFISSAFFNHIDATLIKGNKIGLAQTVNQANEVRFSISLLKCTNSKIDDNSIYSSSGQFDWSASTNAILLNQSPNSRIYKNIMLRASNASVTANGVISGIEIRNSRNVLIEKNDMIRYKTGLLLRGSNGSTAAGTNARIFCNVFDGNFHGIFINNSVFGDQHRSSLTTKKISADNSWSNTHSNGRRIAGNLGSSNSLFVDHFFHQRSTNPTVTTAPAPPYAPSGLLPVGYDLTLGQNQSNGNNPPWNVEVNPFPPVVLVTPFQTVGNNQGSYCAGFLPNFLEVLSYDSLFTVEQRDTLMLPAIDWLSQQSLNPDTSREAYDAAHDLAKIIYTHHERFETGSPSDSIYQAFMQTMSTKPAFRLWELNLQATFNPFDSVAYSQALRDYGSDSLAYSALQNTYETRLDSLRLLISNVSTTFDFDSDLKTMYQMKWSNTALTASDTAWLQSYAFSDSAWFDERRSFAESLLDSIYRDFEAEARLGQFADESENKQLLPSVFPNPAHNGFSLSIPEENAQINVYDISGKLIISNNQNSKTQEYSAINWSEGFYTIHIYTSDGKHYHLKWIKQ